jgi:ABC-type transport system involved in cytochrome bd biosynthesis fused ATPase/permease subunit
VFVVARSGQATSRNPLAADGLLVGSKGRSRKKGAMAAAEISVGKEAARSDLEKVRRAGNITSAVVLGLESKFERKGQPTSAAEVVLTLRSGKAIRLEAEPGAGKSTTLHQLARTFLTESSDCVAVTYLASARCWRIR